MNYLSPLSPHVHWALRFSLAATFLYHGFGKFPISDYSETMGMPVALVWVVALAEIVGGAALIYGAFGKEALTRFGGLIVLLVVIGAIGMVHLRQGWSGMEFQVLLLAVGLYFAARGNQV